MKYKFISFAVAFTLVCSFAFAQEPKEGTIEVKQWIDQVQSDSKGLSFVLHVTVVPEPKWHINSSIEEEAAYKPAAIYPEKEESCLTTTGPITEEGKLIDEYDELMGGQMRYFAGNATFSIPVNLPENCDSKANKLILEYQACLDPEAGGKCVFPWLEIDVQSLMRTARSGR